MSQRNVAIEAHSGPLPSPDAFHKYDEILPGAATRILAMAEKQEQHRHDSITESLRQDKLELVGGLVLQIGGLISAFILGLATLFASYMFAIRGLPWPGAMIGTGGIAALCWVFIHGTKSRNKKQ